MDTPKLEVEETSIAFEHQERPNPNLTVGQRQLVQAGVEGQIRRLIEVDSQGNRTLRATEVLKEASPEIVEVGTGLIPCQSSTTKTQTFQNLLINQRLTNKRLLNWKFKRKRSPLTVKNMKMLSC